MTLIYRFGSLTVHKDGRYWSVRFPGHDPILCKNGKVALSFASVGEALVRAFCFDRRAASFYFSPPAPTSYTGTGT